MWDPCVHEEILKEFAKHGEVARSGWRGEYQKTLHEWIILYPEQKRKYMAAVRVKKRGYEMPDKCIVCDKELAAKYAVDGRRTRRLYCGNKCRWKAYDKRQKQKEGKGWRYKRRKEKRK